MRNRWMAGAAVGALVLGACDVTGIGNRAAPAGTIATGTDDSARAKLSAYTEAYNKLIGTFGLTETATSYRDKKIAQATPDDSIGLTEGWLEQGRAKLKEARALPGGLAEIDAAGDALLAALDRVSARLTPLKMYYAAKSYKEDKLARGKAEDAAMLADFAAAEAANDRLDKAIGAERARRYDGDLARLKAAGDELGFNLKRALHDAEGLVSLFDSADDVKGDAAYARGDALAASLEKTLGNTRAAYDAATAKASGAADKPDINYKLAADNLLSLVGSYREMKQSRDPDDFDSMVSSFNRAVDDSNDVRS